MNAYFEGPFTLFTPAVILAGAGIILYWTLGNSPWFIKLFTDSSKGSVGEVVIRRCWGFLIMGVVPLMVLVNLLEFTPSQIGLTFDANPRVLYWVAGMGIPAILVNRLVAASPNNQLVYPQIRRSSWNTSTFIIEYATWVLYLLGYEFLFRGFLLFASLEVLDTVTAVALNVTLYAIAHLPKGNKETIGSVLLGTLLCIAVIRTGSMWVAFFVHCILAVSNSIFSFKYNSNFSYEP